MYKEKQTKIKWLQAFHLEHVSLIWCTVSNVGRNRAYLTPLAVSSLVFINTRDKREPNPTCINVGNVEHHSE